jgi:hypothetical protein
MHGTMKKYVQTAMMFVAFQLTFSYEKSKSKTTVTKNEK